MKKIAVLLLFVLSLPLFAVSFGYDLSYEGYSLDRDSHNALSVNFDVDIFSDRCLNVEAGLKFGFDRDGFGLMGYEVLLGYSPLTYLDHPLTFLFTNKTLLSPEVKVGISTYRDKLTLLRLGVSPAHLEDVNFTYDFFAPFILIDLNGLDYEGWGLELIRATYYFN